MSKVDEFVVLDDVQLAKPSWQTRNRIRTPYYKSKDLKQDVGWVWLTVPTRFAKTPAERDLRNVLIDYPSFWNLDHMNTIDHYYKRSKHFAEVFPIFKEPLEHPWRYLYTLNLMLIRRMMWYLEIHTPLTMDSELPYDRDTSKSARLANLAQAMGADVYVEPQGGKRFLKPEPFEELGIKLRWQRFDHFEYKQLWDGPFVSHMSALDAMFCLGPELRTRLKEQEVFME